MATTIQVGFFSKRENSVTIQNTAQSVLRAIQKSERTKPVFIAPKQVSCHRAERFFARIASIQKT
jgi:hypothetical protein